MFECICHCYDGESTESWSADVDEVRAVALRHLAGFANGPPVDADGPRSRALIVDAVDDSPRTIGGIAITGVSCARVREQHGAGTDCGTREIGEQGHAPSVPEAPSPGEDPDDTELWDARGFECLLNCFLTGRDLTRAVDFAQSWPDEPTDWMRFCVPE